MLFKREYLDENRDRPCGVEKIVHVLRDIFPTELPAVSSALAIDINQSHVKRKAFSIS